MNNEDCRQNEFWLTEADERQLLFRWKTIITVRFMSPTTLLGSVRESERFDSHRLPLLAIVNGLPVIHRHLLSLN
jgi:hypothetical protein